MGRFFLTLAFLMLALLLIDSVMNDPDVQPVFDRQIQRVQHRIDAISSWVSSASFLPWNNGAAATAGSTASQSRPHDGHGWRWYWSTMLAMAVAALSLAKSVSKEISRTRAAAAFPQRVGIRPTGRFP